MKKKSVPVLLMVLFFLIISIPAQDGLSSAAPTLRVSLGFPRVSLGFPRVALVLSGGAALGVAHVGVLKVLEEVGIPIDLVVGNSMGSLVGGLYAAGYSPGDIEDLASKINWNWLFNQADSYGGSRLIDTDNQILTLEFDKYGISDSNGLIQDQKILSMLSRLTYRVSMVENYDHFAVPFRSLAVDLYTGKEVVLDHGPLALALRASMSVPVIFPPVAAYGGLLVDGGVLNNNPVDVAVRWGADIIISVNVENFQPMKLGELSNISDVASQTMKVILNFSRAAQAAVGEVRIQIDPDLSDFSRLDFFRVAELVQKGEDAARAHLDELTSLAGEISRNRPLEKKDWRRRGTYFLLPEPGFESVRLSPPGRISPGYLARVFRGLLNQEADMALIDRCVEEVIGKGGYSSIYYSLEQKHGDSYELVLTGQPSRERAHDLLLGLNFGLVSGTYTSMQAEAFFALNLRDLTGSGSDWANRLTYFLNEGLEVNLAYSQPLTSFLSVRPVIEGGYRYSNISALSPDEELSTYFYLAGGVNLEFMLLDWWDFHLGYEFSQKWYTRFENQGGIINTADEAFRQWLNLHSAAWGTSWDATTADPFTRFSFKGDFFIKVPFSGSGLPASVSFPYYDELIVNHRQYHTPNENRTFYYSVNLHSYRGEVVSPWNLPTIAGRDGIPGYVSAAEFRGRDKFVMGAGYLENLRRISDYTGFDTYFSLALRMGNVWNIFDSFEELGELKYGLGAGVEMQTNIGVFSLGMGLALDRTWAFYLYFN